MKEIIFLSYQLEIRNRPGAFIYSMRRGEKNPLFTTPRVLLICCSFLRKSGGEGLRSSSLKFCLDKIVIILLLVPFQYPSRDYVVTIKLPEVVEFSSCYRVLMVK